MMYKIISSKIGLVIAKPVCAILFAVLTLAVPAGQAQTGEEERMNTRLSLVSWDQPIREPLYLHSNGDYVPVRVHSMQRSKILDYSGTNPVVLYRRKANPVPSGPDGDSETIYSPVGQAYVDPGMRQPLLFLVKHEDGYHIQPMEDSFDRFPAGSYRFFNYTGQQLMAKFGDATLKLEPQKTAYLKEPFGSDAEYPVLFVVRDGEGIQPLYSNKWQHWERNRYLILISKSGQKGKSPIEFRVLADFPPRSESSQ